MLKNSKIQDLMGEVWILRYLATQTSKATILVRILRNCAKEMAETSAKTPNCMVFLSIAKILLGESLWFSDL